MCGIIGYIGHRNVQEVLLKGLETLEYRGYDSAGIAKRNVVIRWVAVYALIMFIIIFGAYGKGYVAVDPIYANF